MFERLFNFVSALCFFVLHKRRVYIYLKYCSWGNNGLVVIAERKSGFKVSYIYIYCRLVCAAVLAKYIHWQTIP